MSKEKHSEQRAPNANPWVRGAIVGLASARVGTAVAAQQLRAAAGLPPNTQRNAQIGQVMFAAMGQLRGTAVKAAQLLSLDADYLPEAVRAELSKACYQVAPMNRALVGRVFRHSFGNEPTQLFAHFEAKAFAAASLGQVHHARLSDGQQLAVKVQYPGMADALDSDMKLLRLVLHSGLAHVLTLPSKLLLDQALHAIQRQLLDETDYLQEAEAATWFAERNRNGDLEFAQVLPQFSSATVLTQTFVQGESLESYLASNPEQAARDRQGSALLQWFLQSAFVEGRFHGDLHPGNFLFLPEGRTAILDFGCTASITAVERRSIAQAWLAQSEQLGDLERSQILLAAYQRLGLIAPAIHIDHFQEKLLPAIRPFLQWAAQPFSSAQFDFANKSLPPAPEPAHQEQVAGELFSLPTSVLSFDRAWLGLMHLLRRLGSRVDMRPLQEILHSTKELAP
jgi:predicted unusual protein kinase regulating ubiquinone biosynthesis (AarF/ABC1/UbiB family)